MPHIPNIRARIERASRNNVKILGAALTFQRYKWFLLALAIFFPLYPSLSLIGADANAHASDYDDSTIITAYNDTADGYVNDAGMVRLDPDMPPPSSIPSGTTGNISSETPSQSVLKPKTTIILYTVKSGDTLGKLSDVYDVSIEAIEWANDISRRDALKPGMILKIPPISGVIYKIRKGDTLSAIASRYDVDADDIMRVNNLSDTTVLKVGKEIVIPGAVKKTSSVQSNPTSKQKTLTPIPTDKPSTRPTVVDVNGVKDRYLVKYTGLSRGFVPGNCTWYVAQYKSVSWRGNAKQWMKNAKAAGIKTGQTPVPGAIVQLTGRGYNRYYGHVGIVADVTDDHIIVKDMNYRSLYEVTIRKIPKNDSTIDGYIYVD